MTEQEKAQEITDINWVDLKEVMESYIAGRVTLNELNREFDYFKLSYEISEGLKSEK